MSNKYQEMTDTFYNRARYILKNQKLKQTTSSSELNIKTDNSIQIKLQNYQSSTKHENSNFNQQRPKYFIQSQFKGPPQTLSKNENTSSQKNFRITQLDMNRTQPKQLDSNKESVQQTKENQMSKSQQIDVKQLDGINTKQNSKTNSKNTKFINLHSKKTESLPDQKITSPMKSTQNGFGNSVFSVNANAYNMDKNSPKNSLSKQNILNSLVTKVDGGSSSNQFIVPNKKEIKSESHQQSSTSSQISDRLNRSTANFDKLKNLQYYMSGLEKFLLNPLQKIYRNLQYNEHLQQTINILSRKNLMASNDLAQITSKSVSLKRDPQYLNKKTLIFDLDETLVHCNESLAVPYDTKLAIRFVTGQIVHAGINVRPLAHEILKEMAEHFEIVIFTASHQSYADEVINYLDPQKKYVQHRLYRDSCIQSSEGFYIKDLRIFANRSMEDLILVDNAAYSYCRQLQNGVPIIPFYHNKDDSELKRLMIYLKQLINQDVRETNKNTFRLHKLIGLSPSTTVDKIHKTLFLDNNTNYI